MHTRVVLDASSLGSGSRISRASSLCSEAETYIVALVVGRIYRSCGVYECCSPSKLATVSSAPTRSMHDIAGITAQITGSGSCSVKSIGGCDCAAWRALLAGCCCEQPSLDLANTGDREVTAPHMHANLWRSASVSRSRRYPADGSLQHDHHHPRPPLPDTSAARRDCLEGRGKDRGTRGSDVHGNVRGLCCSYWAWHPW